MAYRHGIEYTEQVERAGQHAWAQIRAHQRAAAASIDGVLDDTAPAALYRVDQGGRASARS